VNREEIFQYIDDHIDEHVAHIQRWVRQRSVSWDNMGVAECAEIVAESYRALGCREVEVIAGRFHPGVWAHYDAGAPVTLHSYCMFDTRTVEEKAWQHDPWGAELTATGPYPKVLVGRGAMGAKGPHVAWLNALAAIMAVEGALPVNIMFLAEGEEILGSPTYRDFVARYAERLQSVAASFVPSMAQSPAGIVSVGLGLKGMVVIELTASGEAWGRGPVKTIHSAMGPWPRRRGSGSPRRWPVWSTRMGRAARCQSSDGSGIIANSSRHGSGSCSPRLPSAAGARTGAMRWVSVALTTSPMSEAAWPAWTR
jgi:acetylornithine deacetylase/succinyl-diaminopimelate desuccinylase-like protein